MAGDVKEISSEMNKRAGGPTKFDLDMARASAGSFEATALVGLAALAGLYAFGPADSALIHKVAMPLLELLSAGSIAGTAWALNDVHRIKTLLRPEPKPQV